MTVVPTKIAATEKQASFLLQQKKALKQPMLPRLPKVPEQEGRQNVLLTICMIKKKRVNRLSPMKPFATLIIKPSFIRPFFIKSLY